MLVTCKNCSTRFNVPDDKVAGRRAKMKCKKCGEPVLIDGTALAPSSSGVVSLPEGAVSASMTAAQSSASVSLPPTNHHLWTLSSPSGQTVELSLDDLGERYLSGSLEPGTLVRAPGKDSWKPPYDQAELAAKGEPPERPASSRGVEALLEAREKTISFTDETKALSPAEAATLKELASQTGHAIPAPFDDKTPITEAKRKVPGTFFDDDDVEEAMGLFSNVFSEPPAPTSVARDERPIAPAPPVPKSAAPKPPGGPAAPTPATARNPSAPSPPNPPTPRATPAPPSARPIPSQPPFPGAPSPSQPPFPGAPRHASAPPFPGAPAAATSPFGSAAPPPPPSPPTPPSAPPVEVPKAPSFAALPAPPGLHDLAALPPGSLAAQPTGFEKKKSGVPVVLIIVFLLLAGAAALYFLRPDLVRSLLSSNAPIESHASSAERPLDELEAGQRLATAGSDLGHCSEPNGPRGMGRVNVLFSPEGYAKTAQVSAPFTHTTTGACITARFTKVVVPAFSGSDVIVQTTFSLR